MSEIDFLEIASDMPEEFGTNEDRAEKAYNTVSKYSFETKQFRKENDHLG